MSFMKKPYIIAEIGSNFNQDLDLGKKMILEAKKCGADAVKFQLSNAKKLYPKDQSMFKIFKSIELKKEMFLEFLKFSKKINIDCSASTFDISSARFISKLNVKFHKIASSELTNFQVINVLAKTRKPILLSTGMSDILDIDVAFKKVLSLGNRNIVIMQCGSMYPLPPKKVNLNTLTTFKNKFDCLLGFSDHTLDDVAAITAVGKGVIFFEKHFTLSKKLLGPDHFYALEPNEFKSYVQRIRQGYVSLGSSKKDLLPEERKNSRRVGVYFKKNMKKNEIFSKHSYIMKRPPLGITPVYLEQVLNKKLLKSVKKNSPVFLKYFKK